MRRRPNTKKEMEEEGEGVEKKEEGVEEEVKEGGGVEVVREGEGVEEVVREGEGVDEGAEKDPLKWFGVLVPQSLRRSQQCFSKGLTIHTLFNFHSINNLCVLSLAFAFSFWNFEKKNYLSFILRLSN